MEHNWSSVGVVVSGGLPSEWAPRGTTYGGERHTHLVSDVLCVYQVAHACGGGVGSGQVRQYYGTVGEEVSVPFICFQFHRPIKNPKLYALCGFLMKLK